MAAEYLFLVIILFTIIRTVVYGIYCIKTTGLLSGISMFLLALGVAGTGIISIYK